MSDIYRVVVTVEDGKWLASVPELEGAHTYEPNLVALDWSIREVIALVEDLQEGAERFLRLTYEFQGNAADKDYLSAGIIREDMRLRDERGTLNRQIGAAGAHLVRAQGMTIESAAKALGSTPEALYRLMFAYDPDSIAGVAPPRPRSQPKRPPNRDSGVA